MKKTQANYPVKDVYQILTDKIITLLQQGVIPWQQEWNPLGTACNYVTGKAYRGINALLLNCNHFKHPYYLTFKQASDLGGRVRKGSKAEVVTYWDILYRNKDTGKNLSQIQANSMTASQVEKTLFLRYYNVFNVADVEGVNFTFPELNQRPLHQKIEACEQIIEEIRNRPALRFGGSEAYYSSTEDLVNMPDMQLFQSPESFYCVFFHELVHATGHPSRLARKAEGQVNHFGSELYSKEELVAELGATFLCAFTGIAQHTLNNSAAYIQNWLEVLKGDKKFIVEAAGKAQRAMDYILNTFEQPSEVELGNNSHNEL